jgi:hypothetical protein
MGRTAGGSSTASGHLGASDGKALAKFSPTMGLVKKEPALT